jgi:hypothetical protein
MPHLMTQDPPTDGGYPRDSDLHQMTDDGSPHGPDPARWGDDDWRDDPGPRSPLADWTPIADEMPPEGVIVDTITSDGRQQQVKWEGRLWRLPSGVHYPCLTPEYWRPETPAAGPAPRPGPGAAGAGSPRSSLPHLAGTM